MHQSPIRFMLEKVKNILFLNYNHKQNFLLWRLVKQTNSLIQQILFVFHAAQLIIVLDCNQPIAYLAILCGWHQKMTTYSPRFTNKSAQMANLNQYLS